MRVNLAASATGAVDRAPAFDVKGHDLSFCAAPKDADGTYVKRDPNILWQSVVAFAPRESGAERWQYSLAIRFERAVHTEKGEVK
jgi:hypothetical protein